ncbi:MAG: alpha-amylase family protein [Limisphaerales bacterium]
MGCWVEKTEDDDMKMLKRMFLVVFGLTLGAVLLGQEAGKRWHESALVGMEVGPTGAQFAGGRHAGGYAARFDGREIVRRCVEANGEYLVLWVRDGDYTFHESAWVPRPSGLGDRDVLREAVEEGVRHGLPVIAYCQMQYPAHELREHPEWKVRQADGKPVDYLVCYNSGYTNVVKGLLEEMVGSGVAGFHLDMVDQGFGPPTGCWCEVCKSLYRAEYGVEMPSGVDWGSEGWERMLEFRYRTSDRFEKMLVQHVRTLDPSVTVDFNYHGSPPFSWEVGQLPVLHAGNGDFVTGEAGLWAFGGLTPSFNAAWYRAATPGKPFQVAVQRGVRMYHDQTTRPLNDMRWEMFTLLAHGAFVTMIDKTAYDGSLDAVAYDRIGSLLAEARSKREHFGQEPVRELGIYFSSRTRDWVGRDKPMEYFLSVLGAHQAAVQEHIAFGFIFDERLSLDELRSYPVVCLPNAGILSASEVALFAAYVEEGGSLLISGQSGQFDRLGGRLDRCKLAGLMGAEVDRRLAGWDNWVAIGGEGAGALSQHLAPNQEDGWSFLVRGPATVYKPTTAEAAGMLRESVRNSLANPEGYNKDWPLSAGEVVGPAVMLNQVGKGRVLTFAVSPDYSTASEHAIVEARKLWAQGVRMLLPERRVEVVAPSNVEVVVTEDADARVLRVHLLCYNATPRTLPVKDRPYVLPGLIEDRPMFRASLRFSDKVKGVKGLSEETRIRKRGRDVEVVVEDVHEVILVRY